MRSQLRDLAPSLDVVGITPLKLATTMQHLRRANEAVRQYSLELIERAAPIERWGYSVVDAQAFRDAPREVALRALSRLLQVIGGQNYPPEFVQIERVLDWTLDGQQMVNGRTLNGCRLVRKPGGKVLIAREDDEAIHAPILQLPPGGSAIWDKRFQVVISTEAPPGPYEVRAVDDRALRELGIKGDFPPIEPNRIARTLPAIWRAGVVLSVPVLKIPENYIGHARFLGFSGQVPKPK
jgi:hypothetical protein